MTDRLTPALDSLLPGVHLDVLYERDDRGRLERVRGGSVATPLAHLLRTPFGNRWLIASRVPDDVAARLDTAFGDEPVLDGDGWEGTPPRCLDLARGLLAPFREGGTEPHEYRGPAYAFPPDLAAIGDAEVYLPDGDLAPFPAVFEWVATASVVEQPIVVVRGKDGRVASVCHSARATSEGAAAGLDTAEAERRRGYAVAVTSRWAVEVRASGRMPVYSTWWENEASRGVARRLGLILFAEDWHFG